MNLVVYVLPMISCFSSELSEVLLLSCIRKYSNKNLDVYVDTVHSRNKDGFPRAEETAGSCRPYCLSEGINCLNEIYMMRLPI